jgi:hypothetical protein
MHGILLGNDAAVASWAFQTYGLTPTPVDMALGIIDGANLLVGAALLQRFNGFDCEFSYYGPNTLSLGIIRSIARAALGLGCRRLTVTVAKSKKHFVKGVLRIGFTHECAKVCFYGTNPDNAAHIGMQMVMGYDDLRLLAAGHSTVRKKRQWGQTPKQRKRNRNLALAVLNREEAERKRKANAYDPTTGILPGRHEPPGVAAALPAGHPGAAGPGPRAGHGAGIPPAGT